MLRHRLIRIAGLLALAVAAQLVSAPVANAQVLIWSIPEQDGAFVRFEGTYKNVQVRKNDTRGDLTLEWDTELTIKSVGEETAEFAGKSTPCRWVEFKSIIKPRGMPPGPSGTRIYKVLVPIDRVTGTTIDSEGQPITFLPIVKGYRKFGTGEVTEVQEKALAVNPLIVPVMFYANLAAEGKDPAPIQLPQVGEVNALLHNGSAEQVSTTVRSTNSAKLWLSKELPFGLAQLEVIVKQERKDDAETDDKFAVTATLEIKLSAVEKGENAQSDLPDSK